jgi:hypothetical protein
MSHTRAHRPIPLALTMLIAFFSALAALAVSSGHAAHAHGGTGHDTHVHAGASVTPQELALRNELNRLWEDHITWTRLAIISLTTGSADTQATVGRLLRNQADIGDALKPFYGDAAGAEVTKELRLHILIAADVVAAAKSGNQAELADAQERWERNADEIAALLNSVNPRFWELAAMRAEMHKHLDLTTQEAVARLQGDWAGDVAAYDQIHVHILHMSDLLSTGLVKQFPKRFRKA